MTQWIALYGAGIVRAERVSNNTETCTNARGDAQCCEWVCSDGNDEDGNVREPPGQIQNAVGERISDGMKEK